MAKDILDGEMVMSAGQAVPLAVGFVAAFITGAVACLWMISLVKRSKLTYFSVYCFIVAAIAIFMVAS